LFLARTEHGKKRRGRSIAGGGPLDVEKNAAIEFLTQNGVGGLVAKVREAGRDIY